MCVARHLVEQYFIPHLRHLYSLAYPHTEQNFLAGYIEGWTWQFW